VPVASGSAIAGATDEGFSGAIASFIPADGEPENEIWSSPENFTIRSRPSRASIVIFALAARSFEPSFSSKVTAPRSEKSQPL
jgi:hypothetical protein